MYVGPKGIAYEEGFQWQDGLSEMFKEAKAKGLWFYCSYQSMWFEPNELETLQDNGRFRWGACNWRLRDPQERVRELQASADSYQREADSLSQKLKPHKMT